MSKKLGGSLFVKDGLMYDYCVKEAIESLKALCDEIVIVDAGSQDGTDKLLRTLEDRRTKVICLPVEEWYAQKGRQKLAYFTNVAIESLSAEWNFNLQADEIIHEGSFKSIREAIEQDAEGYYVSRINLWGNSQHQLNVGYDRLPVGKEIIRLCKTKYLSIDDAQSIHCPDVSWNYLNRIKIYHFGFVRSKYKHTHKVKNMLENIFEMGNDAKVEAMNGVFDPFIHFTKEDLIPIAEPLPKFAIKWAAERDKINNFIV